MKTLIIAPRFFGFDTEIYNSIRYISDSCQLHCEKPIIPINLLQLIVQKLPSKIYSMIFDQYVSSFTIHDPTVSAVILIRGELWEVKHLEILKNAFPKAIFSLYQWDSVENLPHFANQIRFFDNVFTFNPRDAINFNVKFKPLFYKDYLRRESLVAKNANKKYLISFIGSDYDDRYEILNKFKSTNNLSDNDFYCHLYRSKYSYFYNKYLKKESNLKGYLNDYKSNPLSENDLTRVMLLSDIILDINPAYQIGLSARTFEALALNKKLVTTNKNIINYDFYDPRNIFIISRDNLYVPKEFFDAIYVPPPESILTKYSSKNWVNDFCK